MVHMSDDSAGPGRIRFAPVILAGGSGTRFWPRSRRSRAKQVLALDGDQTMIQETLRRLEPLASADDVWVITNDLLCAEIAEQLPRLAREHILSEPAARNTAPACALAAFLLEKTDPGVVLGIFPSDHVVSNGARFAEVLRAGVVVASQGAYIVVLGVPPTRPETGYGYIAQGERVSDAAFSIGSLPLHRVIRFTEKPDRARAEEFLAAGNFSWNSGIFFGARTRWRMPFASTARSWSSRWRRLRRLTERRSLRRCFGASTRRARTSVLITPCLSRGRRGVRRLQGSCVCRRTSAGMIWVRGTHSTSTERGRRLRRGRM